MLYSSGIRSLPPMEKRQKLFESSLIHLLEASFHSSHYNTSDSSWKGNIFSITANRNAKSLWSLPQWFREHAADLQSSCSI